MKFVLSIILITLCAACQSGKSAVRFDGQASKWDSDQLDHENPMPATRVSMQYREKGLENNHFKGVVSQVGVSVGAVEQTIELENVGTFDFDVQQVQFDAGIRFYDDLGDRRFQPYFGVGLAPTWTGFNDGGSSDSVVTFGAYAELGIETAISDHARAGIGIRYTGGLDGSIDGEDVELDNTALMFSIAWSF
jgi:opacity protein-like surface antigen